MAKYKVIYMFRDLKDNDHIYKVGDKYPRKGRVTKARIDELSSTDNKIGIPLIEEISEDGEE
ncbi:hypothetical protein [Lysinibacillus varians]|uniref:Uncharacterized protein n=1 Tax=Lysinibacillus varians TaxID=1145276 RepID=A0ABY2T7W8_9BACI|nr:hypothetical protein [Lysinibacillus varians]AHN23272.1 hypothetical protein T479_19965 [Lysinibacillus varians]TKI60512.1 hypothetical protein FC752_15100 [Lysinibacillus varians]